MANSYLRAGKRMSVKVSSEKLIRMMQDLHLALRILDTMQEREPLTDAYQIKQQERRLARERGEFALEVLRGWVEKGDVKNYYDAAIRCSLMLNIPVDRIEKTVDELAHVYQRRQKELLSRAIANRVNDGLMVQKASSGLFTKKKMFTWRADHVLALAGE